MPPESSLIEIDLFEKGAGTLVRLTHSGCPTKKSAPATKGWKHIVAGLP